MLTRLLKSNHIVRKRYPTLVFQLLAAVFAICALSFVKAQPSASPPRARSAVASESDSLAKVVVPLGDCTIVQKSGFQPGRIALAIGNDRYIHAPLRAAANDATDMAELLSDAGFRVTRCLNVTKLQMDSTIAEFGKQIRENSTTYATFYFAGHGMQLGERSFLHPTDFSASTALQVASTSVDATSVLKYMGEEHGKPSLVILDACRDAPLADGIAPTAGQNSGAFAALVGYATSHGQPSIERAGERNGLYTKALLSELRGIQTGRVDDAFMLTRAVVKVESEGRQLPNYLNALGRPLYLAGDNFSAKTSSLNADEIVKRDAAAAAALANRWAQVRGSDRVQDFIDLLRAFPRSTIDQHIWSRITSLQSEANARRRIAAEARAKAEQERIANEQKRLKEDADRRDALRADAERDRLANLRVAEEAAGEAAVKAQADAKALVDAQANLAAQERRRLEAVRIESDNKARIAREAEQREKLVAAKKADEAAVAARAEDESRRLALAKLEVDRLSAEQAMRLVQAHQTQAEKVSEVPASEKFDGYSERQRQYQVGDTIEYRVHDRLRDAYRTRSLAVTGVYPKDYRVEFNNGQFVSDLMGNSLSNNMGSSQTPRQFYPAEMFVGKRWNTKFVQTQTDGLHTFEYELSISKREKVRVAGREYFAFKIEARGRHLEKNARIERNIWIVPGMNADLIHETKIIQRDGRVTEHLWQELQAISQKAAFSL
jgi:hypothetical protein